MVPDNAIYDTIDALLSRTPAASLAELEDTLTSGYAAALTLEAERWRIERRIAEVAGALATGGDASEIADLAGRLAETDDELGRLRGMLESLRAQAADARAA